MNPFLAGIGIGIGQAGNAVANARKDREDRERQATRDALLERQVRIQEEAAANERGDRETLALTAASNPALAEFAPLLRVKGGEALVRVLSEQAAKAREKEAEGAERNALMRFITRAEGTPDTINRGGALNLQENPEAAGTSALVPGQAPLGRTDRLAGLASFKNVAPALYDRLVPKESEAGYTLGPGQNRYDASGRLIASMPAEPKERAPHYIGPDKDGKYHAVTMTPDGPKPMPVPGITAPPKDVKGEGAKPSDVSAARGQFQGLSKDFLTIRDSYSRLLAAAKEPSGAGDLALIFNYMKMLDPGSVVRETEFANAQNAAGVPERVRAMWNRALEGERLSDVTRADFLKQARGQFGAQRALHMKLEEQYRNIARTGGMDENSVVVDLLGDLRKDAPEPVAPPAPKGQSFESLPPAAQYVGKVVRDTTTGKRFKSNGKTWEPAP